MLHSRNSPDEAPAAPVTPADGRNDPAPELGNAPAPGRTDAPAAGKGEGEAADGLPLPRRYGAIAAISFGTALFVLDGNIANVALPTIARDLGVSGGTVVSVVTVYQLVMVMVLLPFANLGERLGLRRLYQLGQVLFLVASGLAILVHSFPMLLAVRMLQATGAGMALAVSAALLRRIYPAKSLGSGLGINSVIVASSNALAPALGGLIAAHADWRLIFVAAVPFALVSLVIGRFLPNPAGNDTPYDWRSGLWSGLSMALIVGGIEFATHGIGTWIGVAVVVLGIGSALGLARRERRQSRPVFPVDLLARPDIGLSVIAAITGFLGTAALVVLLPFRLEQGMGYAPDAAGLLILPVPLTMLFMSPLAGWLSDRVSPTWLGLAGMAIAIVGLFAVAFMPHVASPFDIGWRLVLCAAGYGLFFSPNARMIIAGAPMDRSAAAGGLLSTARLFGQTLGAAGVGMALSLGLGMGPVPMLVSIALAVVAAGCGVVRLVVLKGREPKPRPGGHAPAEI